MADGFVTIDANNKLPAVVTAQLGYASAPGANLARTIKRAQSGEDLKFTAIGDSIADPDTPGNMGGGPVEKTATILESRYGIAITVQNFAESGATALTAHIGGQPTDAIASDADIVFICLGKNDISSDIYGQYAPGYPMAASHAAIERVCAAVRRDNDKADIVVLLEGPYVAGSSANVGLLAYETRLRSVAAVWGAEVVDVYAAFVDYGDYSGLMYDSTHQNSAGNDLYAATIAEHFPAGFTGGTTALSAPATSGLYGIDKVDLNAPNYGYGLNAVPGTYQGVSYVTGGAGWAGEVTSTVGDYLEVTAYATELHVQVSTTTVDAAVVDVSVDGAVTASNLALADQGKNGTYWVPFVTGMTAGTHTLRLSLKSGTLRPSAVAALIGAAADGGFAPETKMIDLGSDFSNPVAIPTDGGFATAVQQSIDLPEGWDAAQVTFMGNIRYRVTGATTTRRYFQGNMDTSPYEAWTVVDTFTASGDEQWATKTVLHFVEVTGSLLVTLRARILAGDKTDCQLAGYQLKVRMDRIALPGTPA